MQKKNKPPETAEGKLMYFVDQMEPVLNPQLITAWKKMVWDCRTEFAQKAKDQVFSKDMQALEPLLEQFRESIKRMSAGGYRGRQLWHMRPILCKILELYGRPADTDHS